MCNPAVAMGMMVVGSMVSAAGAYQSGQNAKSMAGYNAAVSEQNAIYAQRVGAYKERQQRVADEYKRSKMLTLFMKSGVQVDGASSASLVLEEQGVQDEMEALMIRSGTQNEANRWRSQAAIDRMEGNNAASSGTTKAFGSLLTGLGEAGMMGAKAGMFKGSDAVPSSKYMYIYDN